MEMKITPILPAALLRFKGSTKKLVEWVTPIPKGQVRFEDTMNLVPIYGLDCLYMATGSRSALN
jgi:hypothetical protein